MKKTVLLLITFFFCNPSYAAFPAQNISNDSPLVKIWTPRRIIIVIVGFLLSVIGIFLLQAYINSQL